MLSALNAPWVESLLTNHALWRGAFVDLWSIAHIIAGMGIAYLVYLYASESFGEEVLVRLWWWRGVATALLLGTAWEMFERITGLSNTEAFTNSLTDILCTPVGFALGMFLFRRYRESWQRAAVLACFGAAYLVIVYLGYAGFRYYGY